MIRERAAANLPRSRELARRNLLVLLANTPCDSRFSPGEAANVEPVRCTCERSFGILRSDKKIVCMYIHTYANLQARGRNEIELRNL